MNSWWNSLFAEGKFAEIPTACPDIPDAVEIWKTACPILAAQLEGCSDPSEYWDKAVEVAKKLTEKTDIPAPKSDFPKFLEFIFENKQVLCPETPEQCLPFITHFCPPHSVIGDFLVFDFPKSVGSPVLGLQTLRYLREVGHPIWKKFASEHGGVGRILDLYLPFLTLLVGQFDIKYWQFRLEMCDLLCGLVLENVERIDVVDDFIFTLNRQISSIISFAPPEMAADFVRYCIQLNTLSIPRLKPETGGKRLLNLLRAVPTGNVAHAAIVRFAMKYVPNGNLTYDQIATVLIGQDLTSSWDLEVLVTMALKPKSNALPRVLKYIARVMVTNSLFTRTAAILIMKLLRATKDEEIISWYKLFIRNLTFYIGLAQLKGKYAGKIARIAEIFLAPMNHDIPWLEEEIASNITGLVDAGAAPSYFTQCFIVEVNGRDSAPWSAEFELYKQDKKLNMKVFPFETVGYKLREPKLPKGKTGKKGKKKGPAKKAAAAPAAPDQGDAPKKPAPKRGRRPKWQG